MPYTYSWSPAGTLSSSSGSSVSANPLTTTLYSVTVTDGCGLKAGMSLPLTVNIPPSISGISSSFADTLDLIISKPIACASIDADGSDFYIRSGPASMKIIAAEGIGCGPSQATTNIIHLTLGGSAVSGTYSIGLKNGADGNSILDVCPNSIDTSTVLTFSYATSASDCPIKIYTGLSPNADGHNDSWIIDCIETEPDNQVTIINKWGQNVWHTSGYDNVTTVWKGTDMQGQPLPDGTYFYEVKLSWKTYKGRVEIVR
jgi:gliding motility-associated-like protein